MRGLPREDHLWKPASAAASREANGMRISVYDVLGWLAAGMTAEEIISDFPELEAEDIKACLDFAADREHLGTTFHAACRLKQLPARKALASGGACGSVGSEGLERPLQSTAERLDRYPGLPNECAERSLGDASMIRHHEASMWRVDIPKNDVAPLLSVNLVSEPLLKLRLPPALPRSAEEPARHEP